jgi:hypothetical protein
MSVVLAQKRSISSCTCMATLCARVSRRATTLASGASVFFNRFTSLAEAASTSPMNEPNTLMVDRRVPASPLARTAVEPLTSEGTIDRFPVGERTAGEATAVDPLMPGGTTDISPAGK